MVNPTKVALVAAGMIAAAGWMPTGASAALAGVTARVPNAAQNLHVTSERNHAITYRWTKPRGAFPDVTGYLLSWSGHPGYVRMVSTARHPQRTIKVPNGVAVRFVVRPINRAYTALGRVGAATINRSGIASGRPDAPRIKAVTGTNVAGGDTKILALSWGQVDPNGRAATRYQLSKDGDVVACGGRAWTTSASCAVQVSNDGSTHSFRVRATNGAGWRPTSLEGSRSSHRSAWSASRTVVAAGTPDGFSNVSVTPTGNDGEATLTFTVGKSHGKTGTVTCAGAVACPTWDVGTSGGTFTKTVSGLTNGDVETVAVAHCNGAAADAGLETTPCVDSNPVSVTTYGALSQPSISASASGTTVTAIANGNGNGAAATLTLTDTDTGATTSCGPSTGQSSCQLVESGLAYTTTYHVRTTLTDASGHGRSSTASTTAVTTGPPVPAVHVTRGALCGSLCPTCTDSTCSFIHLSLTGFTSSVTCTFNSEHGDAGWSEPHSYSASFNGDTTYWYGYPGTWVSATCDGTEGRDTSW